MGLSTHHDDAASLLAADFDVEEHFVRDLRAFLRLGGGGKGQDGDKDAEGPHTEWFGDSIK